MAGIDNLGNQHEGKEQYEIMITNLPEYFKHDFEIGTAFNKYLKNNDFSLDGIEGCKIYHIRIPCNYDYKKEDEERKKMEAELSEKLKQEWIKRYSEEFDIPGSGNGDFNEHHLQMLEAIRTQREYEGREEDWEFELQDQIDNEKEKRWKKIKTELKGMAFQDIEKFKEYTSLYNLLKREISDKKDLKDIDVIVIDDGGKENKGIHIPIPWKLAEKAVKSSIKSYIKRLLCKPFGIDNKSYKKLVDDYANEIYDIFKISNPDEQKAKLEDLETKKPIVVTIRNSIKKEANNLSFFSCPSSGSYKYYDMLEEIKRKNTIYEVKF